MKKLTLGICDLIKFPLKSIFIIEDMPTVIVYSVISINFFSDLIYLFYIKCVKYDLVGVKNPKYHVFKGKRINKLYF